MQRFTISLDDELARQFDDLIAAKGYENRSEAVRDLIRDRLGTQALDDAHESGHGWCVATLTYVFDHHEVSVAPRVMDLQHDHHDLVISSMHTHLDHDNCLENVVLRGPQQVVRAFAECLIALRGVRHGNVHVIPLGAAGHSHHHGDGMPGRHVHLKPIN